MEIFILARSPERRPLWIVCCAWYLNETISLTKVRYAKVRLPQLKIAFYCYDRTAVIVGFSHDRPASIFYTEDY